MGNCSSNRTEEDNYFTKSDLIAIVIRIQHLDINSVEAQRCCELTVENLRSLIRLQLFAPNILDTPVPNNEQFNITQDGTFDI